MCVDTFLVLTGNHDGLYTFMHWLQTKYSDNDFEDLFTKLRGLELAVTFTQILRRLF